MSRRSRILVLCGFVLLTACELNDEDAVSPTGGSEATVFARCPDIANVPECDSAVLWWVQGICWTRGCPSDPCYTSLPAELELDTASEWYEYEWHVIEGSGLIREDLTVLQTGPCSAAWWSPDDDLEAVDTLAALPTDYRGGRDLSLVYVERERCAYEGADEVSRYHHDVVFEHVLDVSAGPIEPGTVSFNFRGISGVFSWWSVTDDGLGRFQHADLVSGTIDYDTGLVRIDWGPDPRPPQGDVCISY